MKPTIVDLRRVAAHYAISSMFQEYAHPISFYTYSVSQEDYQVLEEGGAKCVLGRGRFTSEVTGDWADLAFAVFYRGGHELRCGIRADDGNERFKSTSKRSRRPLRREAFQKARNFSRCILSSALIPLTPFFAM